MREGAREHAMIFAEPDVRALLDESKRDHVVPVTSANSSVDGMQRRCSWWDELDFGDVFVDPGPSPAGNEGPYLKVARPFLESRHRVYSRVQVGDLIWARENWKTSNYSCADENQDDDHECSPHCSQTYVYYQATPRVGFRPKPDRARIRFLHESSPLTEWYLSGWEPTARMPKWASRLWLEVTAVQPEKGAAGWAWKYEFKRVEGPAERKATDV